MAARKKATAKKSTKKKATKKSARTSAGKSAGSKSSARKKTSSRRSASRKPSDAVALLKEDHRKVKTLVEQFGKTRSDDKKATIAQQICKELKVHAQIEEEIFYPALRQAFKDEDLIDEAEVEHQSAKDLIAQIEGGSPGEDMFDAKVTVLGEYVNHHVKEEENEMFKKARKSKVDLKALGEQLMQRKMELMGQGEGGAGQMETEGSAGRSAAAARRRPSRKSVKARAGDKAEANESLVERISRGLGLS